MRVAQSAPLAPNARRCRAIRLNRLHLLCLGKFPILPRACKIVLRLGDLLSNRVLLGLIPLLDSLRFAQVLREQIPGDIGRILAIGNGVSPWIKLALADKFYHLSGHPTTHTVSRAERYVIAEKINSRRC